MSIDAVREVSVTDVAAVKHFVALERELCSEYPLYVSDVDSDVVARFTGKSAFFTETDFALFIAGKEGRDVARCAAIINRRYQKAKNAAIGFIGYFAAAPDGEWPVQRMLGKAEAWLKQRGVTHVIAPYNGAAVLGMGMLTEGFDADPMFPCVWHPPYYARLLTAGGYEPSYPLWFYTVDFASARYRKVKANTNTNTVLTVRTIDKKRWNQDIECLRLLLNETFCDEWEFHPYNSDEFHEFFDPLKPIIDSRQLLIGEVDGQPAGWCMGFPDWNPLFRSFNGKIGLLQIVKLMFIAGNYNRAGLLRIGVKPEFVGSGIARKLAIALYERYEEKGLKHAFYYPVNESNTRSRKFAEALGGTGRVLYHCYDKAL